MCVLYLFLTNRTAADQQCVVCTSAGFILSLKYGISGRVIWLFFFFSLQRLKFEIAEVMTEIEQLTCVGER